MNTQTKVALIIGSAFTAIVIGLGITVYLFVDKYSYGDFYKRLEARVRIATQYYLEPDPLNAEALIALKNKHLERLEQEKEHLIELPPQANIDSIRLKFDLPPSFVETLLKQGSATGKNGNVFYAGSVYQKKQHPYLVIVSAENYYMSHHLFFLRNLLIVSILIILVLVILFALYFSKQIFLPLKRIVEQVRQITTENIHLRLNETNTNHEIKELVGTFNDLLNRIETAFETQNNFISNASHELGTPLTAIIGETDVALLKPRTQEDYQQTLQNISAQAERLDQIIRSLLFLAQTGYKGNAILFEVIRVDELILETKRLIDKLNPGNKIIVDFSLLPDDHLKLKTKGNRQLLQLAFANLFTNACKYSGNKPVTVFIASTDKQVVVTIKDLGIGIPESEIQYIYNPFFRASNTKMFEGYGIGLPLTQNVIRLHHGQMTVTSVLHSGTTVQVKLDVVKL